MPTSVRVLLGCLVGHLGLGFAAYLHFLVARDYALLNLYFRYAGALYLIAMPIIEIAFAARARSGFDSDEPMHLAWTLILLAALTRLAGAIGAQWLTGAHDVGLVLSGPVAMALLALGLARVVSVQRRFRLLARPTRSDYLLIAAIACITIRQLMEVGNLLFVQNLRPTPTEAILWFSDPLLTVLLAEAVLIRRSLLSMGNGLVARCWGAAVIGVALTSAGNVFTWLNRDTPMPEVLQPIAWYIWFGASTAFAIAPCFQDAASRQAYQELEPITAGAALDLQMS